jgi:hypothetical protein
MLRSRGLICQRTMLTSQVITSFLVVACFTIFLAFFPAFEEFKAWLIPALKDVKAWLISPRRPIDARNGHEPHRFALSRARIFTTPFPRVSKRHRGNQPTSSEQNSEEQTSHQLDSHSSPHRVQANHQVHGRRSRVLLQLQQIRNHLKHHSHSQRRVLSPTTQKIVTLLRPVCDIQVVTGLAIIVAGIGQWNHISFYHEQLVDSYYSLTLNSFWATRISYMNVDADDDIWALFVRRAAVLASCILAVVWQFRIYYREVTSGEWNDDGGPCYRYLDQSNPFFGLVFWNMGQIIFCIALASCLFEQTRWMNEWYFAITEWFTRFLCDWFRSALDGYSNSHPRDSQGLSIFRKLVQGIWTQVEIVLAGFCITVYFLLLQLLAVWSYGDGFYPLTWLAYLGFYTWSALDIISLVVLNHGMIGEEEWTWGFGQILQIVLILLIVFFVVDVFRGKWRLLLLSLLFPFPWGFWYIS